jgi:hypothetical protein
MLKLVLAILVLAFSTVISHAQVSVEFLKAELEKKPRQCHYEKVARDSGEQCRPITNNWEKVQCQQESQRRNNVIDKFNQWVYECNRRRGTRPGPARQTIAPTRPAQPSAPYSPTRPVQPPTDKAGFDRCIGACVDSLPMCKPKDEPCIDRSVVETLACATRCRKQYGYE